MSNTQPSRISRPLPARIEVNARALAQLLNALNGPGHLIRELQVTRNPVICDDNPINTLERELLEAQAAPTEPVAPATMVDGIADGTLFNHRRQGGLSVQTVMNAFRETFTDQFGGRVDEFEAVLVNLSEGN